jgi:hypothetical protein
MKYQREVDMYPEVMDWLQRFLRGRFPKYMIDIHDTHRIPLNRFIERHQLAHYFDTQVWQTYEIRVDVTGFIVGEKRKGLALVECKLGAATLLDFCQLLGYCRVASPLLSFLISPEVLSSGLNMLLMGYDRDDLLEYYRIPGEPPRKIVLAKWDSLAKQIEIASAIPKDFVI